MKDEAFELYQKSVRAVIRKELSRTEHRLPPWLFESLGKVFHHVPTQVPYSVLCVHGLSWEKATYDLNTERIRVGLLLHNGWDIETSCLLYKNFRLAYPQWQVDPHMWRTYTRQQLRDELGPTYGDIVADICSEPTSNPIFGSLLFGELDQPIRRQFGQHTMKFDVGADLVMAGGKLPERCRLALHGCTTEAIRNEGAPLSETIASNMYHNLTGKHLIDPDIDPRTYDYDQAAIRAALRQADCAFDPFRQGQDAIED